MEHTEIRARVAEVAAPPGGWPNLTGDLAEVKFFLRQGQLDEAYDLLSILQRRYPGHPELADFAHSAEVTAKPDAEVEDLVDSILADSSTLGGKVPRRRAATWDAPESEPVERRGRKLTTAHEVVRAALIEDVDEEQSTNPRGKVIVADYAKKARPPRKSVPKVERTNVFEAVPPKRPVARVHLKKKASPAEVAKPPVRARPMITIEDEDDMPTVSQPAKPAPPAKLSPPAPARMPPVRASAEPGPARTKTKATPAPRKKPVPKTAVPVPKAAEPVPKTAEPAPKTAEPAHTMVVDALQPAAPYVETQQHTMAVDALQPAAPFEGEAPEAFEARREQIKRATSKTGRRRRVSGGKGKGKSPAKKKRRLPPADGEVPEKPQGTAFGAGVLARFGR